MSWRLTSCNLCSIKNISWRSNVERDWLFSVHVMLMLSTASTFKFSFIDLADSFIQTSFSLPPDCVRLYCLLLISLSVSVWLCQYLIKKYLFAFSTATLSQFRSPPLLLWITVYHCLTRLLTCCGVRYQGKQFVYIK